MYTIFEILLSLIMNDLNLKKLLILNPACICKFLSFDPNLTWDWLLSYKNDTNIITVLVSILAIGLISIYDNFISPVIRLKSFHENDTRVIIEIKLFYENSVVTDL